MNRRTFLGGVIAGVSLGLAQGTGLAPIRQTCDNWAGPWHRCAVLGVCPVDGELRSNRVLTFELFDRAYPVSGEWDRSRISYPKDGVKRS